MGKDKAVPPKRAGPHGRSFGPAEQAVAVQAIERGAGVRAAAKAAGFSAGTLYYRRKHCPVFRAAWEDAAAAGRRPVLVANGKGGWQVRRSRANRFTRELKQAFLEHFAATCNIRASAAEAGINVSTVSDHLRSDPAFAAAFHEALALGYARLEAAAVAQRLAAMERIDFDGGKEVPGAADDFAMTMQLLREHKRAAGQPGARRPTRCGPEEAFEELEKKLKAFGVRVERGEYDDGVQ